MGQYGVIHDRFWTWARTEGLSLGATCLGAYLLSCPHRSILGAYRLPLAYVCDDLGNSSETVSKWFKELSPNPESAFALLCEKTSFVFLPKYLKWNQPQNPNQRKAIARAALDLPDKFCHYRLLLGSLEAYCQPFDNSFETVLETIRERSSNQYQYQYHKQKEESPDGDSCSDFPPNGGSHEQFVAVDSVDEVSPRKEKRLGTFKGGDDCAIVALPLAGGREFILTASWAAEKAPIYPGVDVVREAMQMREWLLANTKKRKTDRGILGFVTGWLKRAQDRAGPRIPSVPVPRVDRLPLQDKAIQYCSQHGVDYLNRFCIHHGLDLAQYHPVVSAALGAGAGGAP